MADSRLLRRRALPLAFALTICEQSGVLYVIGLGSNLGERVAQLEQACAQIEAVQDTTLLARSRVYESAPLGPPQPMYLNAALLIESALEPEPLLLALLGIEARLGRVRGERWGPRLIDLDLLWAQRPHRSPGLVVPHPGLPDRWFALAPLHDVVMALETACSSPDAIAALRALQPWARERLAALGGIPKGTRSAPLGAPARQLFAE